jgi:homoserine O-acetyltransferase
VSQVIDGAYRTFELGDVELQFGEVLPDARLAYKTYGTLNPAADNVVVLPTFYTGTHVRNEGFFGAGRGIDPARHFIVSVNLFGNGLSSSPSNTPPPCDAARFPGVTLYDNVACQHRLLREALGVESVALVAGWSMAGSQAFQWGAQYPDMVRAILPFCASARTSAHNHVFLEGVKAALMADQTFAGGDYTSPPEAGLKAFGRVYAGWAYSQTFYRDGLYRKLGFESVEELLVDWGNDHAWNWDANDLLAKLWTWQQADIGASPRHGGDFARALKEIQARAIVIACSDDLYFPPADNAIEVEAMPSAELRVFDSPWGHCVANPGNEPAFERFLDAAVSELLA